MTDYIRVKAYHNGEFIGEHLYRGDSHVKALVRCRKMFEGCEDEVNVILIAENYDSTNPENAEHFEACKRCDCVHGLFN